jgi:hypothetical protein
MMKEGAPQRDYSLQEVFNALLYLVLAGVAHGLPPWHVVPGQTSAGLKLDVSKTCPRFESHIRVALEPVLNFL